MLSNARWAVVDRRTPARRASSDHFGTSIKGYLRYQYYHQRVTQPLILQQLTEWGVEISSGHISRIPIEDKAGFHAVKDTLLTAGINISTYIQNEQAWTDHLQRLGIPQERHIRIATEGTLLGTLNANGFFLASVVGLVGKNVMLQGDLSDAHSRRISIQHRIVQ